MFREFLYKFAVADSAFMAISMLIYMFIADGTFEQMITRGIASIAFSLMAIILKED